MRASASSSARCLAAICSDGCACCSEQPPQTPKCGQRGVDARRARLARSRSARASSKVGLSLAATIDVDALAGQRAFDEHRLAVDVRDAASFLVERFDRDDGRRETRRECMAAYAARWRTRRGVAIVPSAQRVATAVAVR